MFEQKINPKTELCIFVFCVFLYLKSHEKIAKKRAIFFKSHPLPFKKIKQIFCKIARAQNSASSKPARAQK